MKIFQLEHRVNYGRVWLPHPNLLPKDVSNSSTHLNYYLLCTYLPSKNKQTNKQKKSYKLTGIILHWDFYHI